MVSTLTFVDSNSPMPVWSEILIDFHEGSPTLAVDAGTKSIGDLPKFRLKIIATRKNFNEKSLKLVPAKRAIILKLAKICTMYKFIHEVLRKWIDHANDLLIM